MHEHKPVFPMKMPYRHFPGQGCPCKVNNKKSLTRTIFLQISTTPRHQLREIGHDHIPCSNTLAQKECPSEKTNRPQFHRKKDAHPRGRRYSWIWNEHKQDWALLLHTAIYERYRHYEYRKGNSICKRDCCTAHVKRTLFVTGSLFAITLWHYIVPRRRAPPVE